MDSSSEGSFAWTDASDDSTDSEIMAKTKSDVAQSGEESESGKNYKKKLQQRLFGSEAHEEMPLARSSKRKADHSDAVDSKRIKLEPESDVEYIKKKKKKTSHIEDRSSDHYDESFLDSKIKNEHSFVVPSPVKVKKNKKKVSNIEETSNDIYEDSFLDSKVKNEQTFVVPSAVKVKKNKKKSLNSDNIPVHNGVDETFESDVVLDDENETSAQNTLEDSALAASSIGEQDESEYHSSHIKKKKKKKSRHRSPSMEVESHVEDTIDPAIEKQQPSDNELLESSLTMSHIDSGKTGDKPILAVNGDHTPRTTVRKLSESIFEKRKSRMSERIQFEEDDECDVSMKSINASTRSIRGDKSKLEAYVKSHPALCRRQLPSTTMLTADDDVWVLRCTQGITAEDFQDKRWTLDSKCKIKLAGNTYEGTLQDTNTDIILLNSSTHGNIMSNISVSGCIRLHRKLPKVHVQQDAVMVNNRSDFIPLPTTKCRHPLLGLNYKKALKLPASTMARLRAAPVEHEPLMTVKKKKKKRKHSERAAEERTSRPLSPQAWDSEKAIERNLFNF